MIDHSPHPDGTIPDIPLTTFALHRAEGLADKPALVGWSGRSFTYAELRRAARIGDGQAIRGSRSIVRSVNDVVYAAAISDMPRLRSHAFGNQTGAAVGYLPTVRPERPA